MTRRDRIWQVKNATELFEDQVKVLKCSDLTFFVTAFSGWLCDTAEQEVFQIYIHLLHTKVGFSPLLHICRILTFATPSVIVTSMPSNH